MYFRCSIFISYVYRSKGPLEKDIKEALKKHIQSTQKMLEEVKRWVKVEQIYDRCKNVDTLRGKVCVTNIYTYEDNSIEVDYIINTGICFSHDDKYFLKLHRKLIAEYPTWQEAVNSKEFKDDER